MVLVTMPPIGSLLQQVLCSTNVNGAFYRGLEQGVGIIIWGCTLTSSAMQTSEHLSICTSFCSCCKRSYGEQNDSSLSELVDGICTDRISNLRFYMQHCQSAIAACTMFGNGPMINAGMLLQQHNVWMCHTFIV